MAIPCPRCGRQYDVTLFQFGRTVTCECGEVVDASHSMLLRSVEEFLGGVEDARKAGVLARLADEVCSMILDERIPDVDIDIAVERAREQCRELFPDTLELFDMVYGSRFRRLREQFRNQAEGE